MCMHLLVSVHEGRAWLQEGQTYGLSRLLLSHGANAHADAAYAFQGIEGGAVLRSGELERCMQACLCTCTCSTRADTVRVPSKEGFV